LLDVRGPTGTGATPAGLLTLSTAELTVVDNDQLGRINFQAPLESSGSDAILPVASIYAEAITTFSASVNSTDLIFATATDAAPVEHLRLDYRGTMRFGVDSVLRGTLQNESWGTVWGNNGYYSAGGWVAVATGASSHIVQDSSGAIIFRSAPSVSAGAATSAVDNVTLLANGNFGINQTVPTHKLHVTGDIKLQNSQIAMTNGYGMLWGTTGFYAYADTNYIRFDTGGAEAMRIISGGNVGIGESAPSQKLTVNGSVLITESASGWSTGLTAKNTNADASPCMLLLEKISASPADNDYMGGILVKGRNDAGQSWNVVEQWVIATDITDGSESSKWNIGTWASGTEHPNTLVANAGSVGIGTAVPPAGLSVLKSWTDAYASMSLSDSDNSSGAGITFYKNSWATRVGYVGYDSKFKVWNRIETDMEFATHDVVRMKITSAGRVKMPAVYSVSGSGAALSIESDGNLYRIASARRYKDNINYDNVDGDLVYGLKPVSYTLKALENPREQVGFIAEDVEEIDPRLVVYSLEGTVDALHYERVTVFLVKAMQDMKATYDARIAALESRASISPSPSLSPSASISPSASASPSV